MKSSSSELLFYVLVGLFVTFNCQENGTGDIKRADIPLIPENVSEGKTPVLPNPIKTNESTVVTTPEPIITTPASDKNTTSTLTTTPINTTTIIPTTTTVVPNTTTLAPDTTTTVTPNTTTVAPTTSTISPDTTTTSTTTPAPTPSPVPPPCHRFDGPSFIGGIVLTLGLLAISLVAYKFYKAHNERNYHTL